MYHMTLTCALFHLRNRENTFYLGHESPQHVPTPMEEPKLNICWESHLPCYVSPFTVLFKVPKETEGRSAGTKDQGIIRQKGLRKGNVIILQKESGYLQKGWLAGAIRGGHLFKEEGPKQSREMETGGWGIQTEHLPHGQKAPRTLPSKDLGI